MIEKSIPVVAAGDTIEHELFGEGLVLTVLGADEKTVAIVQFATSTKYVLLKYAPVKVSEK